MLLSRSLRMTSSSSATRSVSQAAFAERLPSQRSPVFQKLSEHDFKFFHQVIGSGHGYFKGSTTIGGMNIDYMKRYHGNSELALRPVSTEQVSKILKYCNENKLAVVPQGGNTGLVGGSVPVYDEIILSTSLMNQIISFDPISGILVCQVLWNIHIVAQSALDLIFPISIHTIRISFFLFFLNCFRKNKAKIYKQKTFSLVSHIP
eukprot:TRINITY_DN4820_c0_g1_i17.p1 TRINITY_DN4820_c0_g1~~TRINITY_DN4820_c0_g1_i17.p1  ORF type:complete len:205 (+),score=25.70 TRINITY_DN4820_c0_g1_i17:256-870(+)